MPRKQRFHLLSLAMVIFITDACHSVKTMQSTNGLGTEQSAAKADVAKKDQINAAQDIDGFFFGVSLDHSARVAWFVKLNTKTGSGSLYVPPGPVKLSEVKINTNGQLTFRSDAAFGDVVYEFSGLVSQARIQGTIRRIRPKSVEDAEELILNRLNMNYAIGDNNAKVSGMYSNVKYIEESGDLVGKEVILIQTSEGLAGILTSYEGEPSDPYALTNAEVSGKSLRFAIQTRNGTENYEGLFSANRIKLKRVDIQNLPSEVLINKKSPAEVLNVSKARKAK